jgi:hypothetical protein
MWQLIHTTKYKAMPLGIYTIDDESYFDDPMSFKEALKQFRLMAKREEEQEKELDQQIAEWEAART